MFWRAVAAFVALPGMVALIVPLSILVFTEHFTVIHSWGLLPLVGGLVLLVLCVRDFYVSGKGTLAPWEPPKNLVITGLYRYSRNPMYCALALILIGWTLTFESGSLLIYTVMIVLVVHLRVVYGEEPRLAQAFGSEWDDYTHRVRRWL